ncbi:Threonyl-tRNA synthetase [Minicystis rosea]|nr:Threonyl-tRNA synthetase [Minicystis rosea]
MSLETSSEQPGAAAPAKVTVRDVLGDVLAKDPSIVGARVDGRLLDIHTPFARTETTKIEPVRGNDPDGLRIIRHSAAHVMADAVQRLFPGTKVTFGPATAQGFYYDFDKPGGPFTDEDLAKIENEMREIIKKGLPFRREPIARAEAEKLFSGMGETYKREHIDSIPKDEEISLYRHGSVDGEWLDLCEGPHVPTTKQLGAVKLISVAGAYWRGDERNPMLQRVYGTAFPSQKALDAWLKQLEEAKARDHRKLGKELELFMFHEWAPAMPFLLPKGAFIYNGLVEYVRDQYRTEGYEEVMTPQIFDKRLFETSGHWAHYVDNMFFGTTQDRLEELFADPTFAPRVEKFLAAKKSGDEKTASELIKSFVDLAQKPMNCPSHCLMFKHRRRSYRELPWRVADFGRLHRYERGGVVHGMARVRSFCQDDAHVFSPASQLEDEIDRFIKFFYGVYSALGFQKIDIKLATRPDDRIGTDEQWDNAEGALEAVLKKQGLPFTFSPKEGAFYGPKYEFHVEDALGRSWQLGTCQIDYGLPDRFELEYIGADGAAHRPVMLHRAIYGSLERFFSVYIEHTGGTFPVWLAPEQAVIITVSDRQDEYAKEVVAHLASLGLRSRADLSSDKLGAKKRNARLLRVPYIVVVGDREAENRQVAPWSREQNADLGAMPLEDFAARLAAEARPPRLGKKAS